MGANAPVSAFNQNPALVQTLDRQFVPASTTTALRPAAVPSAPAVTPVSNTRRASALAHDGERGSGPESPDRSRRGDRSERSWGKTAMIVGGSAASGAGVGGIVGGKKGALIGAAIGGGAASIFEATQRLTRNHSTTSGTGASLSLFSSES